MKMCEKCGEPSHECFGPLIPADTKCECHGFLADRCPNTPPIADAEIREPMGFCDNCRTCVVLSTIAQRGAEFWCVDCQNSTPLGTKLDKGKPRWSLLPAGTVSTVIAVLEYGAGKYGVDNWQHVSDHKRRYYDAAMRHINAWFDEKNDPESGLPHLAHAVCCLLYLLWFDKEEKRDD